MEVSEYPVLSRYEGGIMVHLDRRDSDILLQIFMKSFRPGNTMIIGKDQLFFFVNNSDFLMLN